MNGRRTILSIALAAAAALASSAPAAQAQTLPEVCNGIRSYIGVSGDFCVYVDLGESGSGTVGGTVSAWACASVSVHHVCTVPVTAHLGRTGIELGTWAIPTPRVDPAGPTVSWAGGKLTSVWISGREYPIHAGPLCVGACA